MSVCISLVAEGGHYTCYSFSETILQSAVYVLPIDYPIKEHSILKQLKRSHLFLQH